MISINEKDVLRIWVYSTVLKKNETASLFFLKKHSSLLVNNYCLLVDASWTVLYWRYNNKCQSDSLSVD